MSGSEPGHHKLRASQGWRLPGCVCEVRSATTGAEFAIWLPTGLILAGDTLGGEGSQTDHGGGRLHLIHCATCDGNPASPPSRTGSSSSSSPRPTRPSLSLKQLLSPGPAAGSLAHLVQLLLQGPGSQIGPDGVGPRGGRARTSPSRLVCRCSSWRCLCAWPARLCTSPTSRRYSDGCPNAEPPPSFANPLKPPRRRLVAMAARTRGWTCEAPGCRP